jgi:hypothetical protein
LVSSAFALEKRQASSLFDNSRNPVIQEGRRVQETEAQIDEAIREALRLNGGSASAANVFTELQNRRNQLLRLSIFLNSDGAFNNLGTTFLSFSNQGARLTFNQFLNELDVRLRSLNATINPFLSTNPQDALQREEVATRIRRRLNAVINELNGPFDLNDFVNDNVVLPAPSSISSSRTSSRNQNQGNRRTNQQQTALLDELADTINRPRGK